MTWADTNYTYKKKISITQSMVSGTCYEFPLLVNVTDSDLTDCLENGYDIKFYNSAQTVRLFNEIEHFNKTTGRLVTWVRLPVLSGAGSGNTLYMYYKNASETAPPSASAVWSGGAAKYIAVWHVSGANTWNDSVRKAHSGYGYTGTRVSGETADAGSLTIGKRCIYYGPEPNTDGTSFVNGAIFSSQKFENSHKSWVHFGDMTTPADGLLKKATFEYLLRVSDITRENYLLQKYDTRPATDQLSYIQSVHYDKSADDFKGTFYSGNAVGYANISSQAQPINRNNTWYYLAMTLDTNAVPVFKLCVSGVVVNSSIGAGSVIPYPGNIRNATSVDSIGIQRGASSRVYADGMSIDELRITSGSRSSEWLWSTKNNWLKSNFITFGAEQNQSVPPVPVPVTFYEGLGLRIYFSCNTYPNNFIECACKRWDEDNYNVIIETYLRSGARNALFSNVVPGAVTELYNILGTPYYKDMTYESGNTIILEPQYGYGVSSLRQRRMIGVKNITDNFANPEYFNIKIEGYRLDT